MPSGFVSIRSNSLALPPPPFRVFRVFRGRLLRLCLLLALLLTSARAADWPQFRGPDSTAVAPDAELPAQPKIDWSVPLPGRGLASPIVVGDRVYVSCSSGPKQERLHLICFSAADGAAIWERQLRATGRTMSHPKTSIASSSPCSAGGRVFALWSSNDLAAFDLEGNLLWVRGLTADYPNASNSLGMASSPIVIGETLVVMIENDSESYSLGLDVKTGRNLWKLDRPKAANWTSPYPLRSADGANPLVLLQSSKGLEAVDPVSGSRVWAYTEGASTSSSGVVAGGIVYAPVFRHHRARASAERRHARAALAFEANQPRHDQPAHPRRPALQHQQRRRPRRHRHQGRRATNGSSASPAPSAPRPSPPAPACSPSMKKASCRSSTPPPRRAPCSASFSSR